MKFDNFIWDYDGTLFDTYDAVTRAYHRGVQELGIEIPFAELRWLCKHSLGWAAQQLEARFHVPSKDILAAYARYAPQEETMQAMQPYAGVPAALSAVCARGGHNYLYSHRDHVSIEALAHYGLREYFSGFITKDDAFPRKPAPDALLYLKDRYGLDPRRSVMVGDRLLDVEAGLNAGMSGALFDPERFCGGSVPTPYRFDSMDALRLSLIEEA